MLTRPIPSSGELLPVIGLGTWQTFDVGSSAGERGPLEKVLARFVSMGGKLVDSSPMYGGAETVVGEIAASTGLQPSLFLTTKVWTSGKSAGIEQMESSFRKLRAKRIDLMQVHNLVDVRTHLPVLRELKDAGRIRYIGITHYNSGAYAAVEEILRREPLDFLQINYSLAEREAERRLLPLAHDRGVAVIANRPFASGDLFRRAAKRPLPAWAADLDCVSWARFFLAWIIAHPSVTCVIPATSKLHNLEDNMPAAAGRLPDEPARRRMAELIDTLR